MKLLPETMELTEYKIEQEGKRVSELGQLLKKARLEKGLSLDDVQEITKIRKRYLEAIEEGNFKALPGNFYVRAFVKTYAETVGLNPDEILSLHKNTIPAPTSETAVEPIVRKRRRSESESERVSKWTSSILMWCFLLLILGLIYYFFISNYDGTHRIHPFPMVFSAL